MDVSTLQLLKDFGLPVFLLLGLIATLIITGKWLGKNAVLPMVNAHISLVEDLKNSTKKTSEFVAVTAETLKKMEQQTSERHAELKNLINGSFRSKL